jgi:hypothetical protein
MRLHGYDLKDFSQGCEAFQQLHRKGRNIGKSVGGGAVDQAGRVRART